ncbi:hypothetical protein BDW69DRAFT_197614 [Aspergillus filifer]
MATSSTLPSNADNIIVGAGTAGLVAGPNATDDPRIQEPAAYTSLAGSELDWNLRTVSHQAGLNNRELDHPAYKVVGVSSAINGSAFLPPSPAGINAWAELGIPNGPGTAHQSASVPPATGPIQAWNEALETHGYSHNGDFLAEQTRIGARAYTAATDPRSGHRSSADGAGQYYGHLIGRDNVTIMTGATVQRIILQAAPNETGDNVAATARPRSSPSMPSHEVILAAGAFNSSKSLDLGITTTIDLPGVGENMQNHIIAGFPVTLKPNAAIAELTPGIKALAFARADLSESDEDDDDGGDARSAAIQTLLQNHNEASAIYALAILPNNLALLAIGLPCPFSTGDTHATSTTTADPPRINPRFITDNRDIHLLTHHTRHLASIINTSPALRPFFQEAQIPSEKEALETLLRGSIATAAHHTCGTAAMVPREAGGVVGENLKAYGTVNVRVVDASVFPLVPSVNPLMLLLNGLIRGGGW